MGCYPPVSQRLNDEKYTLLSIFVHFSSINNPTIEWLSINGYDDTGIRNAGK